MIRVCSQLTFCSPQNILRRMVVEQNEIQVITSLFCLDDSPVESFHTLFYDGILSAEIVSVKQNSSPEVITKRLVEYQYIDVSVNLPGRKIKPTTKPLILDFGNMTIEEINRRLARLVPALTAFSAYELIAACTYYPSVILDLPAGLAVGRCTKLLLWQGLDLVNKRITNQTSIREF